MYMYITTHMCTLSQDTHKLMIIIIKFRVSYNTYNTNNYMITRQIPIMYMYTHTHTHKMIKFRVSDPQPFVLIISYTNNYTVHVHPHTHTDHIHCINTLLLLSDFRVSNPQPFVKLHPHYLISSTFKLCLGELISFSNTISGHS